MPVRIEEAVVEVDPSRTNQIISKKIVVINHFNLDRGRSWERSFKFKQFVEPWVTVVQEVILALVEDSLAVGYPEVGVTKGADVTTGKVYTVKHVQLNCALGLNLQLFFDHLDLIHLLKYRFQLLSINESVL